MKDINLPLTQTVSLTIDAQDFDMSKAVEDEDGQLIVQLGEAINSEISEGMDKARSNGGKVLYATTSIEQQLEGLLLKYFMGPFVTHDHRRDIFEREILQSSALSFRSKKELVSKVVSQHELLKGKKKNKLQGALKKIMGWRNAFAHGKIQHDNRKGCFIKYYSGGVEELRLTDEFWSQLEGVFKDGSALVNEALKNLEGDELSQ
jgi:hypothetical protein|tara:strand:+ start:1463 stop:2077 length:615 start_codon:yes stop_codon:yes gene_type:complete